MDFLNPIKELFNWAAPVLDNVPIVRAIFGFVLVFFAPGFAWTLILFKKINYLERLVLSFALSLAIVTLSILGLNVVINMRITGLNALLTILLLIAIPLILYFTQGLIRKRNIQHTEEK